LGLLPAVAKADETRNDRLCRQGMRVDNSQEKPLTNISKRIKCF